MHRPRRRTYPVVLRAKVRARRRREIGAVLAVAALAGLAAATVRRGLSELRPALPSLAGLFEPKAFEIEGAPESRRQEMREFLAGGSGMPGTRARALAERFPFVSEVRVRPAWPPPAVRYRVTLRRAVARVGLGARTAGYLDAGGAVFSAPAGIFPEDLPRVELGSCGPERAGQAAAVAAVAADPGVWPAPLTVLRFLPELDVWEAVLADATVVIWGDGRWIAEKLARINEVLADARARWTGPLRVDLRHFDDGRILVRPIVAVAGGPAPPAAGVGGGP